MADYFKRVTWEKYQQQQQNNSDAVDQQVTYITDKDIYAQTKKVGKAPNGLDAFVDILYTSKYGFSNKATLENLKSIEKQLIAGIYFTINTNPNATTEEERYYLTLYYFDGIDKWWPVSGSGVGDGGDKFELQVADTYNLGGIMLGYVPRAVDEFAVQVDIFGRAFVKLTGYNPGSGGGGGGGGSVNYLKTTHTWYDGKRPDGTEETYTDYDEGNVQISGYFEGRVDGGGW